MALKYYLTTIIAIALLLCTMIWNSNGQCLTDNDEGQSLIPSARTDLYRGEQTFTVSLLKTIVKNFPNENIFFSPYSTYHALLLAYFGAKDLTQDELTKALNLNWAENKYHVFQAYRIESQMRAKRYRNSSIEFSAVDKIFVSKSAELKNCMKTFFHNELETLDFETNAEECRLYINEWIEKVTKNQIKDILMPGDITAETKIVLANAAYFKGQWLSQFDPNDTKKEPFFNSIRTQVPVDMMYRRGTFNFATIGSLDASILELPYLEKGINGMSMFVVLPSSYTEPIEKILERLTPETFTNIVNDVFPREVDVKLPKFTFEKTLKLVPMLQDLGITSLFGRTSNLSGFSDKVDLVLGDATHKAKIQVDEEGSTAAAATVMFTFRSARPLDPTEFTCDHPFLFFIYDNKSNAVLFVGIYKGPEK